MIAIDSTAIIKTLCSICIATYCRPALLRQLLSSLCDQQLPENVEIEIIVVDNDVEESARSIVASFKGRSMFPLGYHVQIEKNISLTRNVSVQKAQGDYLLFIDDDETAEPYWVITLLKALVNYNADALFRLRLPAFSTGTSPRLRKAEFYYPMIPQTGELTRHWYTSNCIVKSALLKGISGPIAVFLVYYQGYK